MKKLLSLLLIAAFLCLPFTNGFAETSQSSSPEFSGLNDPSLLSYVEGTLYQQLLDSLSDEYFVENVNALYISQEYLEELAYNSQSNVFFCYTLQELDAEFQGTRYIFTLGENDETVVEPFEAYDDSFERIIQNVAMGTGVILICVTVSAVTGGAAPAISMIFATAAKTGVGGALIGSAIGGVSAGIVTGVQTGDMSSALKSAAVAGSEGFKWGAISGAISGGTSEAIALKGATLNGLSMNEAAMIQRESKYPLDVIKGFKNMEQYNICKEAGLTTKMINGKAALVRDIDLNFVDEFGRTNYQRMTEGFAALDPATGQAFELHHIGQKMDSTLAILTKAEHMQDGNNLIWHEFGGASNINRVVFSEQRAEFWMDVAQLLIA